MQRPEGSSEYYSSSETPEGNARQSLLVCCRIKDSDICLAKRLVLLGEQKLYSVNALLAHFKYGDCGEDDVTILPHPFCQVGQPDKASGAVSTSTMKRIWQGT